MFAIATEVKALYNKRVLLQHNTIGAYEEIHNN
jgi:hypothetical protein